MTLSNFSCMCDPLQLAAKCVRASFAAYNSNTLICDRSSMSSQSAPMVVSELVAPHPSRLASEYIIIFGGGAPIKWWEVDSVWPWVVWSTV